MAPGENGCRSRWGAAPGAALVNVSSGKTAGIKSILARLMPVWLDGGRQAGIAELERHGFFAPLPEERLLS